MGRLDKSFPSVAVSKPDTTSFSACFDISISITIYGQNLPGS